LNCKSWFFIHGKRISKTCLGGVGAIYRNICAAVLAGMQRFNQGHDSLSCSAAVLFSATVLHA
jgi:hypothetical protein